MSGNLRATEILWDAAVLTDSVAANSNPANIGPQTNVALFVSVSGAITLTVQAGVSKTTKSGRNGLGDVVWHDYVRADSFETANGVEGNEAKIVFSGSGAVCIDLSPFAPQWLRLTTADGNGVTVSASTVAVG